MRQSNWRGPQGQGSCTWATMVSLLRWQGRYRTADWVRQNCGDGEWPDDMAEKLDGANDSLRLRHQRRREVLGVGVPHAAGLRHHGHGRRAHGRLGPSRRQVGRPLGQQRRREVHLGSARDADCRVEGERRVGRSRRSTPRRLRFHNNVQVCFTREESNEQAASVRAVCARPLRGRGPVPRRYGERRPGRRARGQPAQRSGQVVHQRRRRCERRPLQRNPGLVRQQSESGQAEESGPFLPRDERHGDLHRSGMPPTSRGCPPCGCRSPMARWSTRRRERTFP